jgi:aspartate aminotransferase
VLDMRDEYRARTRLVSSQLDAMDGISCAESAGAFYVFPNVSELMQIAGGSERAGATSAFTDRILEEALVALIAGTDFGAMGVGHVRVSCANSRENLQLAVDRIGEFARRVRENSPVVTA